MSTSAKRMASKAAILIVCGLAAFATGAIVVHAATSAQTAAKKKKKGKAKPSFYIRAQVTDQLAPGKTVPLKLSLASNQTKNIWITRMAVRLKMDQAHVTAGCNPPRDYRIVQLPKKFFPYKLPRAKKLKGKKKLKVKYRAIPAKRANGRPALMMVALSNVNQDACKGATLTISFVTKSQTKKPRGLRAKKSVATQ